jgi:hypothetical protein
LHRLTGAADIGWMGQAGAPSTRPGGTESSATARPGVLQF